MWKSALHFHTGVYPCIGAIYMHRPRGLFQLCIHTRYFQLLSAQLQNYSIARYISTPACICVLVLYICTGLVLSHSYAFTQDTFNY
jgi:hypothetical protein